MRQHRSLFEAWRRAEFEATRLTLNWRLALESTDGSATQRAAIAILAGRVGAQRRIAHAEFEKAIANATDAARALRYPLHGETPPPLPQRNSSPKEDA